MGQKISVGSIIKFGKYPQKVKTISETVQRGLFITRYEQVKRTVPDETAYPIEWIVLEYNKRNNCALVISHYGLDAHCFDESKYRGWEKSEIRTWLNSTFLNTAFTASEQAAIMTTTVSTPDYHGNSGGSDTEDKIWLLSREEAKMYFTSDGARKAVPTEYAVAQGAWQSGGNKLDGVGCCWWWLRLPGSISSYASYVYSGGSIYHNYNVNRSDGSVRPAFWLNLDSAAIN